MTCGIKHFRSGRPGLQAARLPQKSGLSGRDGTRITSDLSRQSTISMSSCTGFSRALRLSTLSKAMPSTAPSHDMHPSPSGGKEHSSAIAQRAYVHRSLLWRACVCSTGRVASPAPEISTTLFPCVLGTQIHFSSNLPCEFGEPNS